MLLGNEHNSCVTSCKNNMLCMTYDSNYMTRIMIILIKASKTFENHFLTTKRNIVFYHDSRTTLRYFRNHCNPQNLFKSTIPRISYNDMKNI